MAVYEITRFSGGISDYEDRGIPGAFKFGSNLDIRKDTDSLSCNQALVDEGLHSSHSASASQSPSSSLSSSPSLSSSASPSPTPSPSASASPSHSVSATPSTTPSHSISPSPSLPANFVTTFQDLILWFVKCSDGYTYGFGDQGYIYKRDQDGIWSLVYKDPDGRIRGACEKPSFNKRRYLLWATSTKLHRKLIPGRNDWNDVDEAGSVQGDTWPKTNLTATEWHTMAQVGGDINIANGEFIAEAAYDDSYTNEALDLIPGNLAKTIVERKGFAIFGTVDASDPTKGTNAAIDTEFPLAQVGDDGELYYADLVNSISIKRFPGGGKVNPGGVCNQVSQVKFFQWESNALSWVDRQTVGNLSLWAIYGATSGRNGLYSFGRKNKNKPVTMNLEYELDADELGATITVKGTTLVSYRDGATYGVKAVDPTTKAVAVYEGLDYRSPIRPVVEITPWKMVELYMKPLPSGCSVEFWYKMNKTGNFIQAKVVDNSASFSTTLGKKAIFRISTEGEVFEPRIVLRPHLNTTPEIHRIRTYFG